MSESKEFSSVMVRIIDDDMMKSNGGYHHPTRGGKLYITKDGVTITLNEDEVRKLVKTIGANFRS